MDGCRAERVVGDHGEGVGLTDEPADQEVVAARVDRRIGPVPTGHRPVVVDATDLTEICDRVDVRRRRDVRESVGLAPVEHAVACRTVEAQVADDLAVVVHVRDVELRSQVAGHE